MVIKAQTVEWKNRLLAALMATHKINYADIAKYLGELGGDFTADAIRMQFSHVRKIEQERLQALVEKDDDKVASEHATQILKEELQEASIKAAKPRTVPKPKTDAVLVGRVRKGTGISRSKDAKLRALARDVMEGFMKEVLANKEEHKANIAEEILKHKQESEELESKAVKLEEDEDASIQWRCPGGITFDDLHT